MKYTGKQWSHRIISVLSWQDVEEILDDAGAEGWELVTSFPNTDAGYFPTSFGMKRLVTQAELDAEAKDLDQLPG